jgi:hypothetical protein
MTHVLLLYINLCLCNTRFLWYIDLTYTVQIILTTVATADNSNPFVPVLFFNIENVIIQWCKWNEAVMKNVTVTKIVTLCDY